jgi:signal transduction histidine kinase
MKTELELSAAAGDPGFPRRVAGSLELRHPLCFVLDPLGRLTWASSELSALAADSSHGESAEPGLCAALATARARMKANGGLLRSQLEFSAPDGSPRRFELSLFAVAQAAGDASFSVGILRREGEAAPPPPSAIAESAPQALLAVDGRGFLSWANPAAGELLGLAPAALEGCALAALAIDAEGLEALLRVASAPPRALSLTLRRGRGGAVAALLQAAPLHPGSRREGAVVSLHEAAGGSTSDLARRNEELEHCINALAHDLRSPLVALLGFSRLLRQDYGDRLDETAAHFLDRIEQAGRTMEGLIHDLLELSRIGKPVERPRLVDPRAVLLQLAAELKPRLDANGLRLVLPESPPLVLCDRTRLYQVFSNLIGNAIDHLGECEDRRIVVEIAEEPACHRITVRDFGRGVAPEHQQRIFEVFQTLGSRRDGRRGTGMGLAIVRRIAESHGGRAWVESRPGQGAAFRVTFPRG